MSLNRTFFEKMVSFIGIYNSGCLVKHCPIEYNIRVEMTDQYGELYEENQYGFEEFCNQCGGDYYGCECEDDEGCFYCGQFECVCKCGKCDKDISRCRCRYGPTEPKGRDIFQREMGSETKSGSVVERESENETTKSSSNTETEVQEGSKEKIGSEEKDSIDTRPWKSEGEVPTDKSSETVSTGPTIKMKGDPVRDFSEGINSKFVECTHCKKKGHSIKTCFAVVPCKHCGKTGHRPSNCFNRSKEKKNKGKGDRNQKKNDLVGKSQLLEDEKIKAQEDGLKEVITELKDEIKDIKEVDKIKEEMIKQDEEKKERKARYEERFAKKKRSDKERLNDMTTPEEKNRIFSEGNFSIEDITDGDGDGNDVFLPQPSPHEVDDDYDEDPRSYTFTSPIEWPSFSMWKDFATETLTWEVIVFLSSYLISMALMIMIFMPALATIIGIFLGPLVPYLVASGWIVIWLLMFTSATAGMAVFVGVVRLTIKIFRNVFMMVKWKNTYMFLGYLNSDGVDLRTDNQKRSETKHKDAVYARYRYTRRLHICYTENYRDTGPLTVFLSRWMAWSLVTLGKYIPYWLVEFDKEIVMSLEAFDQIKSDFGNMDFGSTDVIASDKIKTALKRIGTIWISRHLKTDPLYMTSFLAWAYFKHNQQKTSALPFYRAPLNLT